MACKGLCEVKCGGDNLSEISSWVKYPSSEIPLRVSFKGEIPLKEPPQGEIPLKDFLLGDSSRAFLSGFKVRQRHF